MTEPTSADRKANLPPVQVLQFSVTDLSAEEVQTLGMALDQLPHGQVRRLVDKIQGQIKEQYDRAQLARLQQSAANQDADKETANDAPVPKDGGSNPKGSA